MSEFRGLYTLWLREVKRFMRDKARVVISFVQPLLWLVIFAGGFGARILIPGTNYQQYLFPGIIGQTLLFTAMFMGISVIWDKEFGFMKEILVSPVSRFTIFIGKMLGDSTATLLQGVIVFVFGFILGIPFDPLTLVVALPIMLLIVIGLVSVGLIIASFIGSLENFGAIQTFINLPLFFLSGALFPISGVGTPEWLRVASIFDPLTYGIDALRTVILGSAWTPIQPLYINLAVVGVFDVVMVVVGTWAFSRMK
ncbi:MAG: ABC transporter permease [Candidatus Bathyarchaeota archaeon]|nr:ABC transporter permease [Candidatus Bathyarchaeota archaeon]